MPAQKSEHLVQFYDDEAELVPALVKYVGTALNLGHDAIVIARPGITGQVVTELRQQHLQRLSQARPRGRLTTLDAQATLKTFMVDGWPDPQAFERNVAPVVAKATSEGRSAVAYGEMVALLCEQGQYAAAVRLEKVWNDLLGRLRFSLLCAYPMRLFTNMAGKGSYPHICEAHERVIAA